MKIKHIVSVVSVVGAIFCAPAWAQNSGEVKVVKSFDGRFDGEMVGTPAEGSRFSQVKIGMLFDQVGALIGQPSNVVTHETGKRWIPYYFGNDVRRLQASYPGEGCLTFTAGNQYGAGGAELIRIAVNPQGVCN